MADQIRAVMLHQIRWDKDANHRAAEHLKNLPPRQLLIGIMDAVFKIEAAQAYLGPGASAAQGFLGHALSDLCALLYDPDAIIDVPDEPKAE